MEQLDSEQQLPSSAACISFSNYKGGTGKTTLCVNAAGFLAKMGKKVLVLDLDPQADATSGLGIDPETLQGSMYDVFLNECPSYEGVPLTEIIVETHIENLHLAPAELDLSIAEVLIQEVSNRVLFLTRIVESVKNYYDYILLDIPSGTGLMVLSGLIASDVIVAPVDSSIYSIEALDNLKRFCDDVTEQIGHEFPEFFVVLNRFQKKPWYSFNKTNHPSEKIKNALLEKYSQLYVIPDSSIIYDSQQAGTPISHFPKALDHPIYSAIHDLTQKLIYL